MAKYDPKIGPVIREIIISSPNDRISTKFRIEIRQF